MKTLEFITTLVCVAMVASLVTLLTGMMFPRNKAEGFEDGGHNLPEQFTPQEEAKLRLLRNKKYFVPSSNGVTVNMPIWAERELRVTNASPIDGAVRLQRSDGTTARLSVADTFEGKPELFTKDRQEYYMIPAARDLVITNASENSHRIQPYTYDYNSDVNNTYLAGYPKDPATGAIHSLPYKNKQDAYRECTRIATSGGQCGGITKDPVKEVYTLRVGNTGLQKSPYGEISTMRL